MDKIQPSLNVHTRQHNIVTRVPMLKNHAKAIGDKPEVEDVWKLFFTDNIMQKIVLETNKKITQMKENYKNKNLPFLQSMDEIELKALIGLLAFSSVLKAGNESVHSFFATDGTGRDVFRCTMSKERFLFLLNALRFDDSTGRAERLKNDSAAAISEVFTYFIENCQRCYNIGAYACVDEMLVAFRGRCKFRMYMPNKPAIYGIKIMALTDARTHYLFNAFIYTGKSFYGKGLNLRERELNKPTQSVYFNLQNPLKEAEGT